MGSNEHSVAQRYLQGNWWYLRIITNHPCTIMILFNNQKRLLKLLKWQLLKACILKPFTLIHLYLCFYFLSVTSMLLSSWFWPPKHLWEMCFILTSAAPQEWGNCVWGDCAGPMICVSLPVPAVHYGKSH